MTKHTPPPWTAELRAAQKSFVRTADGRIIARDIREPDDATVVAAALEMLEALETVARVMDSPEWQGWEAQAVTMELRNRGLAGDRQGRRRKIRCARHERRPTLRGPAQAR